jgi:hypothetical protein
METMNQSVLGSLGASASAGLMETMSQSMRSSLGGSMASFLIDSAGWMADDPRSARSLLGADVACEVGVGDAPDEAGRTIDLEQVLSLSVLFALTLALAEIGAGAIGVAAIRVALETSDLAAGAIVGLNRRVPDVPPLVSWLELLLPLLLWAGHKALRARKNS